jgi:hypothetical protein
VVLLIVKEAGGIQLFPALQGTDGFVLRDLQVVCGTMGLPTATVKLECPDGSTSVTSHVGIGPVDAAYKAVDSIVDIQATLEDYTVTSVTSGIDSVATTRVGPSAGVARCHELFTLHLLGQHQLLTLHLLGQDQLFTLRLLGRVHQILPNGSGLRIAFHYC